MNILVCMKAVPSSGQVQVDGSFRLQRDGAKLEWNIADQSALELALTLKGSNGTVTVITMGPPKLEESIRDLFARCVDRAILLTDSAFAGSDTFATANALGAAIKRLGNFDLILCGRRAIDGETGQVPAMLSCNLGIPCISNVDKVTLTDNVLDLERCLEDGVQFLQLPCPALISVCEYSYTLRLPGIMGMRKAKGKTVEILGLKDIPLLQENCGLRGSLTKVLTMDSKFPGLRNGVKEHDPIIGAATLLSEIKEVAL